MQRRAFELQLAGPDALEAPDPLEDEIDPLSQFPGPALVAAGEHDMQDFIIAADALAAALPAARRELIPGAGHLAPLEAPEITLALLLDLLH